MRAFVAIDLPENIKLAIARQQHILRTASSLGASSAEIRWTRAEGIHLTLKFLGEISEKQLTQVTGALATLGSFQTFPVELKGFGFFPDAQRPRVFWVGVDAPPALAQLAGRVEASLKTLGFTSTQHAFTPHLTLARFKISKPQPNLKAFIEGQAGLTLGRFEVSEFFLFESKLSSRGAEYRKIARFPQ